MKAFNLDTLSLDEMSNIDAGSNDPFAGSFSTSTEFGVSVGDSGYDDPGFVTIWSFDV